MDKKRFINPVAGSTITRKTETVEEAVTNLLKDERIRKASEEVDAKQK